MTLRKIKKWGYEEGLNTTICIPADVNRNNLAGSIQIEWVYFEESIAKSDWWNDTVLPKLRENREGRQRDIAFEQFLEYLYRGFRDKFIKVFEAERVGEKISPVSMEH